MKTGIPAWSTPEYDMLRLRHVVDIFPATEQCAAYLTATITFIGNGDTITEVDLFHLAANYFREPPEVSMAAETRSGQAECR